MLIIHLLAVAAFPHQGEPEALRSKLFFEESSVPFTVVEVHVTDDIS